jgi:hypothetical protein
MDVRAAECPLVAVTALAGGAGATTLGLALAREAATTGRASLVAETCDAGLREVAGAASPFGLRDVARLSAAGERPRALWADVDGVRVMTWSGPTRHPDDPATLGAVIADARRAHSLVVLDCGGEDPPDVGGDSASHALYVAPASATGLARAARRLRGTGAPARAVLAVVVVHGSATPPPREVRRLADGLCDAVVLVPHHPSLVTRPRDAIDLLRASAIDLLSAIDRCP